MNLCNFRLQSYCFFLIYARVWGDLGDFLLSDLMSANKLPFGLILQEATVIPLLLIHRLLLLGYVFVVGHMSSG